MSPSSALASPMPPEAPEPEPTLGGDSAPAPGDERRGDRAAGLTERVRYVWGQALFAVSATEEEAQRVLARLAGWVEMGPEEARRLTAELTTRLQNERAEIERSLETAVRAAIRPFRLPARAELEAIEQRISRIETRIDALLERRQAVK